MAWSNLTNNQMVTLTDIQGGGFTLNAGQSHTTSNQLVTKSMAITKYNLGTSYLSGYSSNQLVPKGALIAASASYYSHTVRGAYYSSSTAWGDSGGSTETVYTSTPTLAIGSVMFSDPAMTSPVTGSTELWWWNSSIGSFRISETTNSIDKIWGSDTSDVTYLMANHSLENYPWGIGNGTASGSYGIMIWHHDSAGSNLVYNDGYGEISGTEVGGEGSIQATMARDGAISVLFSANINMFTEFKIEAFYLKTGDMLATADKSWVAYNTSIDHIFILDITDLEDIAEDSEISLSFTVTPLSGAFTGFVSTSSDSNQYNGVGCWWTPNLAYFTERYFVKPSNTITLGDVVYVDSELKIPFNGGGLYYGYTPDGIESTWRMQISSSGVITAWGDCGF